MRSLIKLLKKNNLTTSSCESFTGGMFSSLITNYKNSSKYFKGGFCCYSDNFKIEVLGIDEKIIKKYSAVSEQTLNQMLIKTQVLLKSDIVFGFTGYAPPTSVDESLKGLSYIGFRYKDKNYITKFCITDNMSRKKYKLLAINKVINDFLIYLK
ncbi:competence damage-inducible protein A [Spiroplasma corruscae]|uniref:Competence damage-inducible protein A n=1 Tax=Spiroplasma corruscae TaxID=216934 RepID=A0A222EPT0_9MOLU|nr:nicotinamide-nucleotide amidohydrolase family protein [Spiroplasma corruscae]ASP28539.1 competence damage-inducible protein A [Spiroplasma corruscae]